MTVNWPFRAKLPHSNFEILIWVIDWSHYQCTWLLSSTLVSFSNLHVNVKTLCLGSDKLIYEKQLKPFVIQALWLERCFKCRLLRCFKRYTCNDPHINALKLRGFPDYNIACGVNKMADRVSWQSKKKQKKNTQFWRISVDHFILRSTLQTLFIDQLASSKATCPFKASWQNW